MPPRSCPACQVSGARFCYGIRFRISIMLLLWVCFALSLLLNLVLAYCLVFLCALGLYLFFPNPLVHYFYWILLFCFLSILWDSVLFYSTLISLPSLQVPSFIRSISRFRPPHFMVPRHHSIPGLHLSIPLIPS